VQFVRSYFKFIEHNVTHKIFHQKKISIFIPIMHNLMQSMALAYTQNAFIIIISVS
jgi:hypothetical protein